MEYLIVFLVCLVFYVGYVIDSSTQKDKENYKEYLKSNPLPLNTKPTAQEEYDRVYNQQIQRDIRDNTNK